MLQEVIFVDYLPPLGVDVDPDIPTEIRTKKTNARLVGCSAWNINEEESGFILVFEDDAGLVHIQEINRFGVRTHYHHSVYQTLDDARRDGYEREVNEVLGIE
jgi:hypothetical protein